MYVYIYIYIYTHTYTYVPSYRQASMDPRNLHELKSASLFLRQIVNTYTRYLHACTPHARMHKIHTVK